MKILFAIVLAIQFAQRPPLTPAETLLESVILRAIDEQPGGGAAVNVIEGAEPAAGEILITCRDCTVATQAMQKLNSLIRDKGMPQPSRTIRLASDAVPQDIARRARAAIHVAQQADARPLQVVRGLWSTASLTDEVVEIFARHGSFLVDVRPFENVGQLGLDHFGVPTTTIVASASASNQHAAFVAAAAAYFLATLPNAGAEALLSHLTVGAHARLADDGRRAVAMMGSQQRAGADVLVFYGQAIEREQRRMRSFERFMPEPVDPTVSSRIADMEKGITSVWTSMGLTSSPFVPAAERLRGRAGEDRRIPTRTAAEGEQSPFALRASGDKPTEPPAAFAKLPNAADVLYELASLIDGRRSISDIRDVLAAEFGSVPLPAVVEYFERLEKSGLVSMR